MKISYNSVSFCFRAETLLASCSNSAVYGRLKQCGKTPKIMFNDSSSSFHCCRPETQTQNVPQGRQLILNPAVTWGKQSALGEGGTCKVME